MEAKETLSKIDIQSELIKRQNALDAQIDHLDKFITDLISHKISLENANRQIEQIATAETDPAKKGRYYNMLRMNIELLTKIFNSISELESIKHRYHKEIDDVLGNKFKLIAVEIRKIEDRLKDGDTQLVDFFEKLGNAMSNLGKPGGTQIKTNLDSDPNYKL